MLPREVDQQKMRRYNSSVEATELDWLSSVRDQGFAIVPGVLDTHDLDSLLTELSDPCIHRSRAGVRHAMRFACVSTLARDERLLGMARKTLGNSALPFKATMFDKSPTANWLVAWHQDTALPLKQRCDTPDLGL
jgi:hypothetical protein